MKVLNINNFRNIAIKTSLISLPFLISPALAQSNLPQKDSFEHVIYPSGTTNQSILSNSPCPKVTVCGAIKNAKIVVDTRTNRLYKYDEDGTPLCCYSVATGAKNSPTSTGLRIVSHVESFPYKEAPKKTKRRRSPRDFGPKIIILDKLDAKDGSSSQIGEFIHGNRDSSSIGKYASHGCIRMDNKVIQLLSKEVKRGDLVLIK